MVDAYFGYPSYSERLVRHQIELTYLRLPSSPNKHEVAEQITDEEENCGTELSRTDFYLAPPSVRSRPSSIYTDADRSRRPIASLLTTGASGGGLGAIFAVSS
jgi:hypothetical protein